MGSIASDGWKNCRSQSLLNVLLVTKKMQNTSNLSILVENPRLLSSLASFLRNVLNDPELTGKIIQVVMDNAANCTQGS